MEFISLNWYITRQISFYRPFGVSMSLTTATAVSSLKAEKQSLIKKYVDKSLFKAFFQLANTIIPTLVLFYFAVEVFYSHWYLSIALMVVLVLFILRIFVLMHDCGHNSFTASSLVNKSIGFVLGVFCGVPQYVWSKHHDYHHATNGNWEKYRGPLAVLSVTEFKQLSQQERIKFAKNRRLIMGPLAGFLYFIFNPRFNWIKGCIELAIFMVKQKLANMSVPVKSILNDFETKSWATWAEFWHMTANNLVLFLCWGVGVYFFDPVAFFVVYTVTLSLAGASGIILFTVQHNYEDSYATDTEHWCYDTAALEGTCFLKLPKVLNWFTADIAYHHVHHLSARIPNYNLEACHEEYKNLFACVKQVRLADIPHCFKYIIWDENQHTLITLDQFNELYA